MWINCFVKGILELQDLGIFHEDLRRRNIFKFCDQNGKIVFKIIDFNWAIKVTPRYSEETFSNTKKILS